MPEHWDEMLANLEDLRGPVARGEVSEGLAAIRREVDAVPPGDGGQAFLVAATPADVLPLVDVRERLVALEAAIGAIGVQLVRLVVQLGEVRAMLDDG